MDANSVLYFGCCDEIGHYLHAGRRKVWETTGTPNLLVIGQYRMGYEITPKGRASLLRVFIDYALPDGPFSGLLGGLFGNFYARWCTRRMADDAAKHFQ